MLKEIFNNNNNNKNYSEFCNVVKRLRAEFQSNCTEVSCFACQNVRIEYPTGLWDPETVSTGQIAPYNMLSACS